MINYCNYVNYYTCVKNNLDVHMAVHALTIKTEKNNAPLLPIYRITVILDGTYII